MVHAPLLPGRLVQTCVVCCDPADAGKMLLCDSCDCGFHWYCVGENHRRVPRGTARRAGLPPGWHTHPETQDLLFQHCHPLLQRDRCSMRPSTRFNGNAPERSDNMRCMPVVATLRQQGATAMLVHATSQQRCHSITIMGNVVPLHMQGATWTALSALSAMHLLQLL